MSQQLDPTEVATLLDTFGEAGPGGVDQIVPVIYDELRQMAHRQLAREHGNRTLQTTALVHEAYIKLVDGDRVTERGRAFFFAAASRAIRQVLVDHARKRRAAKRGGGIELVTLEDDSSSVDAFAAEVVDLDEALDALAERNPRHASVVECRFFGGMSVEETAVALDISARTVKYDWALARAWLYDRLHGSSD